MVYIFIGPDGSGKTTAAIEFARKRKAEYIKGKKDSPLLPEMLTFPDKDVVYDRSPLIDDIVYAPILAHRESSYLERLVDIRAFLSRCTIFYFSAAIWALECRVKERGDEYIVPEQISGIEEKYQEVIKLLELDKSENFYTFDTTFLSPAAIEIELEELVALEMRHRKAPQKQPKIAHIVPVSCLNMTRNNQYHMCLYQNLNNERYREFYACMAREGKFVLLDNGAAEGAAPGIKELVEAYRSIGASELILPDTLGDALGTLCKTEEAFNYLVKEGAEESTSYMVVPQGRDMEEWLACARIMISRYNMKSIGVPKILEASNSFARVTAVTGAEKILNEEGKEGVEIHLLGCNTRPEILSLLFRISSVRGCDSAFAYLAAQACEPIQPCSSRPEGRIDFLDGERIKDLPLAMEDFNRAVGINNNVSGTWRA